MRQSGRIAGRFSVLTAAPRSLHLVTMALLMLASTHGCGSAGPAPVQEDKSSFNLQRIGAAYAISAVKLGRPPRDATDLSDAIRNGPDQPNPADILRSPDDNENYVIVWGVDFRELAKTRGNFDVVFAYEKVGKEGKRHVLKPPSQVIVMTDEEFQSAEFPPGHKPAP